MLCSLFAAAMPVSADTPVTPPSVRAAKIQDALEILKYLAKMDSVYNNADDKPVMLDALAILKGLAGITAPVVFPVTDRTLIQLSQETQSKIKADYFGEAWLKNNTGVNPEETVTIVAHLGSFNGYEVLVITNSLHSMSWGTEGIVIDTTTHRYIFDLRIGDDIIAWKDGEVHGLWNAHYLKHLTDSDVRNIHFYHKLIRPLLPFHAPNEWGNDEIENMNDQKLIEMYWNWQETRCQEGDPGFYSRSAGSLEEALELFQNHNTHSTSVTFIGETDYYYSFEVLTVFDSGTKWESSQVSRFNVFKDSAFYSTWDGSSHRYIHEVRMLDYDSVLAVMDLHCGTYNSLYTSLDETDDEYIYTNYSFSPRSSGIGLGRNQIIIDKKTGSFLNTNDNRAFVIVKQVPFRESAPKPTRPMVQLTKEQEEKFRNDVRKVKSFGSDYRFDWDLYYGSYNGSIATLHRGGMYTTAITSEVVDDFYFRYYHGYSITVWNKGVPYRLQQAYDKGLITKQDLSDIAYYHMAIYNNKGLIVVS